MLFDSGILRRNGLQGWLALRVNEFDAVGAPTRGAELAGRFAALEARWADGGRGRLDAENLRVKRVHVRVLVALVAGDELLSGELCGCADRLTFGTVERRGNLAMAQNCRPIVRFRCDQTQYAVLEIREMRRDYHRERHAREGCLLSRQTVS